VAQLVHPQDQQQAGGKGQAPQQGDRLAQRVDSLHDRPDEERGEDGGREQRGVEGQPLQAEARGCRWDPRRTRAISSGLQIMGT